MKNKFLLLVVTLGFGLNVAAQEISKNAIGLRIGDNDGFGGEISFQRALGKNNRLELDLGIRSGNNYDGFKLTGLYQWVWQLEGDFNWYAGAGGGIGNYSYELPTPLKDESETFLFAAGNVGIEYNFDIPIQLSLDVRPEIGFGDFRNDLDFDLALGVRYRF
ncbi:hypothetical protein [Lacinutrix sp.]|uniref:hypothetical protein n=1 Tax=Lacinutrix sp. TaxID=1937692 RepID=UPI0035C85C5E